MVRLRRVLDGERQLAWLAARRFGHRFYFGRYTGQTPHRDLQRVLRGFARRAEEAERLGAEHRPFVARPLGAELLTRQDMQLTPPDILITNFSMLNVMLNRRDEAAIFDADSRIPRSRTTRASISSSTSCTATRAPPAPRSRCCSAAFCTAWSSSSTRRSCASSPLPPRSATTRMPLAPTSRSSSACDARQLRDPARHSARPRHRHRRRHFLPTRSTRSPPSGSAIVAGDGRRSDRRRDRRRSHSRSCAKHQLAVRLVDAAGRAERTQRRDVSGRAGRGARSLTSSRSRAREVLAGVLSVLAAVPAPADGDDDPRVPVRAHLFFRTVPGWWACARADCPAVPEQFRSPTRTVGKLYAQPTIRCECGARCLDLWACETCGDHLLGGYASATAPAAAGTCCRSCPTSRASPTSRSASAPTRATASSGRRRPDDGAPMHGDWESGPLRLKWIPAELDAPGRAGRAERRSGRRTAGCSR